jgi:hypothetical protein
MPIGGKALDSLLSRAGLCSREIARKKGFSILVVR